MTTGVVFSPHPLLHNWYIYAAQGLKMGGLGSGPSLKMRGFQRGSSQEKQMVLELKITKKLLFFFLNEGLFDLPRLEKRYKELYIFEKEVFWSGPGKKIEALGAAKAEKWGAFTRHMPVLFLYGSTTCPTPRGIYILYYTIF